MVKNANFLNTQNVIGKWADRPSDKNMGLDSVEILVEVEKTLGIEISDAEASKISTVGDFHESTWKHIQNKRPLADRCFSQMTFL